TSNYHLTTASPVVDRGVRCSNTAFPPPPTALNPCTGGGIQAPTLSVALGGLGDIDGQYRPQLRTARVRTPWDLGADELPGMPLVLGSPLAVGGPRLGSAVAGGGPPPRPPRPRPGRHPAAAPRPPPPGPPPPSRPATSGRATGGRATSRRATSRHATGGRATSRQERCRGSGEDGMSNPSKGTSRREFLKAA